MPERPPPEPPRPPPAPPPPSVRCAGSPPSDRSSAIRPAGCYDSFFSFPVLSHEHVIDTAGRRARRLVQPLFRAVFRNRQTLYRVDSLRLSAGRVRYSGFTNTHHQETPQQRPVQG